MSDSETPAPQSAVETVAGLLKGADKPAEAVAVEVKQGEPAEPDTKNEDGDDLDAIRKALKKANDEAKTYRLRLKEFEEAGLSEVERAKKEAREASDDAATARAEVAKLRLATRYSLTEEEAADLPDDPEKAERTAARLGARKSDQTPSPKPDLTQGSQSAMPLNGDGLTEALARAVGR